MDMAAVEGIRDAEEGGQHEHHPLVRLGKTVKVDVLGAWMGASMVTGDLGDEVDLGGGEAVPGLFPDDPRGDLVVTAATTAFRPSDVMKAGSALQDHPFFGAESMQGTKVIKEAAGEKRDVDGVLRLRFEPFHGSAQFKGGGDRIHQSSRRAAKRRPRVLGRRAGSFKTRSKAS